MLVVYIDMQNYLINVQTGIVRHPKFAQGSIVLLKHRQNF